jgi:hypothetical protein
MITINGCKLFGRKKADKYPHTWAIDEYHEKLLAAVMIHDHREAANAIERALEVAVSQYGTKTKDALLLEVEQMRKLAE